MNDLLLPKHVLCVSAAAMDVAYLQSQPTESGDDVVLHFAIEFGRPQVGTL